MTSKLQKTILSSTAKSEKQNSPPAASVLLEVTNFLEHTVPAPKAFLDTLKQTKLIFT